MASGGLRHIAKHSAIYASADILAKLVGFLLLPLYSRKFSAAEYGILALIQIMNTFPSRLVTQGVNTSALKAITLDYAEDPVKRRIALSTAYYYLLLSSLVVNLGLFLSLPILSSWLLKTQAYNHLLTLTFITGIFEMSQMIPLNVLLRARFRSVFYSVLSFGQFLASVGLNIYFIVFAQSGIAGIVYTDLIVGVAVAVIAFFIIRPHLVPVFSRGEVARMVRYGWPLVPARIAMWILDFADRFQLQRLSTLVEVGLYTVGAKYAKIFQVLFSAQFEKVWPSVFFPLSKEKDAPQRMSRLFTYFFMAGCGLGLAVVLFVDPIVRLTLEESYWRASAVVGWLVAGFILEMSYQVFTVGIRLSDHTRSMPIIVGAGAAFNVVANLWVLPRWGMVGAGFTTFCANLVLVLLGYHVSNRLFPVVYDWSRLAKIATLFTTIAIADYLWSPQNPMISVPLKTLGILLFGLGLLAFGILNAEDLRTFREMVGNVGRRMRKGMGGG